MGPILRRPLIRLGGGAGAFTGKPGAFSSPALYAADQQRKDPVRARMTSRGKVLPSDTALRRTSLACVVALALKRRAPGGSFKPDRLHYTK